MKLYILLLSITLGASLFAGVVVAPIIFGANEYLTTITVSRFESGILMTQIFLKLSYLVNFTAFIIFIYEAKAYFEFKANKILIVFNLYKRDKK